MGKRAATKAIDQSLATAKKGRIEAAAVRYGLSHARVRKLADEANAATREGKIVMIDFEKIDSYLAAKKEGGSDDL